MDKQIKLFLDFLENDKKLVSNTLQSYKRDILQYQEYVEENSINYLKVNSNTIKEYFDYLTKSGKRNQQFLEI